MSRELNKLLKEIERVKQEALARGVKPMQSATAVTAVIEAPEESDPNRPTTAPRTLVVSGTMDYLNAIKKLPRQLLEARYLKDIGAPCPPTTREWIIEKMARKVQDEAYLKFEGEIPKTVQQNDARFNAIRPRLFTEDDEDGDDNEPGRADRKFDPTMKAKALIGNPFTRGIAYQLFALVEMNPAGMQYQAIVLLLKQMNNMAQDWAERKVQKVFTKWVDRGWVELV